jgi:hypothetical protein
MFIAGRTINGKYQKQRGILPETKPLNKTLRHPHNPKQQNKKQT